MQLISSMAVGLAVFHGLQAQADSTKIINLSSEEIYVAQRTWEPYSSRAGDLTVVTPAGWWMAGWYTVKPCNAALRQARAAVRGAPGQAPDHVESR